MLTKCLQTFADFRVTISCIMARLLNNPIVLNRNQTEGQPFELHSGDHAITAGIRDGATFPTTITLQRRFKDETGQYVDWIDDFTRSSTDPTGVFQASPEEEYRVTQVFASGETVGASVKISPIKMTTN